MNYERRKQKYYSQSVQLSQFQFVSGAGGDSFGRQVSGRQAGSSESGTEASWGKRMHLTRQARIVHTSEAGAHCVHTANEVFHLLAGTLFSTWLHLKRSGLLTRWEESEREARGKHLLLTFILLYYGHDCY